MQCAGPAVPLPEEPPSSPPSPASNHRFRIPSSSQPLPGDGRLGPPPTHPGRDLSALPGGGIPKPGSLRRRGWIHDPGTRVREAGGLGPTIRDSKVEGGAPGVGGSEAPRWVRPGVAESPGSEVPRWKGRGGRAGRFLGPRRLTSRPGSPTSSRRKTFRQVPEKQRVRARVSPRGGRAPSAAAAPQCSPGLTRSPAREEAAAARRKGAQAKPGPALPSPPRLRPPPPLPPTLQQVAAPRAPGSPSSLPARPPPEALSTRVSAAPTPSRGP